MRKLNQFAKFDKAIHVFVVVGFVIAIMVSIFSCQEYYIGKSKEELAEEMWEVDSLLHTVQMQLDSLLVPND